MARLGQKIWSNLSQIPKPPLWSWLSSMAMGKEMNFLCDAVVLVSICFISLIMAPVLAVTRAWTFLPHRTLLLLFLGHRQTWNQTCEWCLTMFYNIHASKHCKTITNSFVNKLSPPGMRTFACNPLDQWLVWFFKSACWWKSWWIIEMWKPTPTPF